MYCSNKIAVINTLESAESDTLNWFSSNKILCNNEKTLNMMIGLSSQTQDTLSVQLLGIVSYGL